MVPTGTADPKVETRIPEVAAMPALEVLSGVPSIHNSKGLNWIFVFVVGAVQQTMTNLIVFGWLKPPRFAWHSDHANLARPPALIEIDNPTLRSRFRGAGLDPTVSSKEFIVTIGAGPPPEASR